MSDPVVNVERVVGLTDDADSDIKWVSDLKDSTNEREVAALLLGQGDAPSLQGTGAQAG